MPELPSSPPKALLLDMDGVLYHGDRALPGAPRFMRTVAPIPHLFLTNNPICAPVEVAARLATMDLGSPDAAQILTSAEATACMLQARKPGFRFYAIGANGLHNALGVYGTPDADAADYVVVGEGPGLDFETLTVGLNLIVQRGAQLISTNPDHNVDAVRDGRHLLLPGGGALVAALEVASGQRAETIGKPYPQLYRMALQHLGLEPSDCVMIGDRPDTDIAGAAMLGMRSALVRTGRFAPNTPWPEGTPRPTWDVEDLEELLVVWRAQYPGWLPSHDR